MKENKAREEEENNCHTFKETPNVSNHENLSNAAKLISIKKKKQEEHKKEKSFYLSTNLAEKKQQNWKHECVG